MKTDRAAATAHFPPAVEAAAATWVGHRDAGLSDTDRRQLEQWLAADPLHRAAFARADAQRTAVDWALHAGAVDEVLAGLAARATRRRKHRRTLVAVSAAALFLISGWIWRGTEPVRDAPVAPTLASVKIVEPRRLSLPDGSTAELRDGAEMTIDFSGALRRVTLRSGAAHFQVAHDPARPFVVSSAGLEVRAVGTAFAVQVDAREVEVVVTEGRVAVGRVVAPAPVMLTAGQGLAAAVATAASPGAPFRTLPETELSERLAWRVPRIEFAGAPLTEVVAVMNRHNVIQFVLADAELGQLQLSGVVGADKVDALREILETSFPILAERNGDRVLLRRAR